MSLIVITDIMGYFIIVNRRERINGSRSNMNCVVDLFYARSFVGGTIAIGVIYSSVLYSVRDNFGWRECRCLGRRTQHFLSLRRDVGERL